MHRGRYSKESSSVLRKGHSMSASQSWKPSDVGVLERLAIGIGKFWQEEGYIMEFKGTET
jgi:hypothetical protein